MLSLIFSFYVYGSFADFLRLRGNTVYIHIAVGVAVTVLHVCMSALHSIIQSYCWLHCNVKLFACYPVF